MKEKQDRRSAFFTYKLIREGGNEEGSTEN